MATPLDPPGPLGIPPALTDPTLQQDSFKELINKLAWALGSTYHTHYSRSSSPTRQLAIQMAKHVVQGQGWPGHISKGP